MAKITRKNLSRGVRLPVEAVFDVFDDAATELTTVNIDADNLEQKMGTFRVNLNFPTIDSRYFVGASDTAPASNGEIVFAMPFCMPPLQDDFVTSLVPDEDTPQIILEEFQMSWDQRGEPCAISDRFDVGGTQGDMNFDNIDLQDMTVALLEKPQIYDPTTLKTSPYVPETEVFSFTIPSTLFSDRTLRINPFIVDKLNKAINPYRTYMFSLKASLQDDPRFIAIVNLNVSMKFKTTLVARDKFVANVNDIQNIPTQHLGATTADTLTVTTPAANTLILADDATRGIAATAKRFDEKLEDGLHGGYLRQSHVPVVDHLAVDACYDIICVPMWGNFSNTHVYNAGNAVAGDEDTLGSPYIGPARDRRVIPIAWPMTIHHVMAVVSYVQPIDGAGGNAGLFPTSATFINDVGVGMGTGAQGDIWAFEDIATTSWTSDNGITPNSAITIDRIKASRFGGLTAEDWDFEILSVPLVTNGGGAWDNGTGYYAQGKPVFVGRSTSSTAAREQIGGATSATIGAEQFLEVRWHLRDSAGLAVAGAGGSAGSVNEIYAGMTGHYVLICGKKHLAGGSSDLPL